MGITYRNTVDKINKDQLEGFFAGWPKHPDTARHLEILRNSYAVWTAFDGEQCVGFINALSDSIFYAYIPLLEVLPGYQGQGIGRELVSRMLQTLEHMYAVDIICDESAAPFYEKMGLSRCVGMVKRNFQNQETAHNPLDSV